MRLAVLCPGQGHQHSGMLDILASEAEARAVLEDAAKTLRGDPREWLRAPAAIARNRVAQPLIGVAQLAAWRALRGRLPPPLAFAGYSVGEVASYACAGALDAPTLCTALDTRARLMDEASHATPGRLVALGGIDARTLGSLCANRDAWPAIALDEATFVVGGTDDAIAAVTRDARAAGARVEALRVDVAAHTPLLAAAVAPFRAWLEQCALADPPIPVVAGIDARLVRRRTDAIDTLSRQLAEPIAWSSAVDALYERGCRVFVELPPGNALSRRIGKRFADVEARAVDEFQSLDGVAAWALAHAG